MIPHSFIQDLLNRTDIVDVIERYLKLKKAGANYSACCPFHSEKTASFTVSPAKQFYHCFGCGAHGSAVGFMMEYAGMDFVEAIKALANQVGMPVPEIQTDHARDVAGEERRTGNSSHDLLAAMQTATRFYRDQLKNAGEAIAYLKSRGLTGETAARFGVGYAAAGWQNLAAVFPDYRDKAGGQDTTGKGAAHCLVEAGLVIESDDGKRYDRFRERIMFPILNQKGSVVGFGGRIIEQGEPKYLNSPETPLFDKGRELYNLFAARAAIREAGWVVVVEGYMDVIMLAQHGVDYAVATLGTATTPWQIQKLLRQTDNVIFCFDGDKAGRKAAWRALENSLSQIIDGKSLAFLFLPEGEDPDSYIRKVGKDGFEKLLAQSLPLSVFLFREQTAQLDLQTTEGRIRLVREVKPLLAQVNAPMLRLMLLKRLVELSGFSQKELEEVLQIKRTVAPVMPSFAKAPRPKPASPYQRLIGLLLHDPAYAQKLDKELLVSPVEYVEEVSLVVALVELIKSNPDMTGSTIIPSAITWFHDSPHRVLLEKAAKEALLWDNGMDSEIEFDGVIGQLQSARRRRRMTELQSKSLNTMTYEEREELRKLAAP